MAKRLVWKIPSNSVLILKIPSNIIITKRTVYNNQQCNYRSRCKSPTMVVIIEGYVYCNYRPFHLSRPQLPGSSESQLSPLASSSSVGSWAFFMFWPSSSSAFEKAAFPRVAGAKAAARPKQNRFDGPNQRKKKSRLLKQQQVVLYRTTRRTSK